MDLKIELTVNIKDDQQQIIKILIDPEKKEARCVSGDSKETTSTTSSTSFQTTQTFQDFMELLVKEKTNNGRLRTSETYQTTLNNLNRFLKGRALLFQDFNDSLMENYQEYLKSNKVCMNTISFYMRILKATYLRAVRQKLTINNHPFANVYTGMAKTQKRALSQQDLRKIKDYIPENNLEQLSRDLFLFSFYTRGMAFVDMAYLKKSDIRNGILYYTRKKTGQNLTIKWEPVMQEIVDSYETRNDTYLLPIIHTVGKGERNQYRYIQHIVNKNLVSIGIRLSIHQKLTMYVARHSWASIAKLIDIPLSVISEALGHSSEKMTTVYLKSIDETRIDSENERIINLLNNQKEQT